MASPEPKQHLDKSFGKKELQDIILAQQEAFERLKATVDHKEDVVPSKQYEAVLELLEQERIAHALTKSKLLDTQDRLEFALGEVEVLTKQIEREKSQYDKSFGVLKHKALKETTKNVDLENECRAVRMENDIRADIVSCQQEEVDRLNEKLKKARDTYQHQMTEINIQLQQEAYIAKVMEENEKKKTKRKEQK